MSRLEVKEDFKKFIREAGNAFRDTLMQNGTLFTVFAVLLILASGVAIVEDRSNWWVSVLAITAFFLVVFLFMNARVVLKCILACVLTVIASAYGFMIGSFVDPYNPGGVVWMLTTLFLFFVTLAISYVIPSGKSRWGAIAVSQIIFFVSVYMITVGIESVELAAVISLVLSVGLFILFYRFTKSSRASKKNMPKNVITSEFVERLTEAASNLGMKTIDLRDPETNEGSLIVWDERAFVLHPVESEAAFAPFGRKANKLGYRSKNINPWLLNIAHSETPSWQSRGADMVTVLIDLKNKNGHSPKTIGVSLPDTKKKLPVGVFPGKIFVDDNVSKIEKALESIEIEFSNLVEPLKDKNKKALERMSMSDEINDEDTLKEDESKDF